MTSDPRTQVGRTYEIDGMRGWAAFIVVLFHVYCEMLGRVIPEMRNPVLMALINDRLAIVAFFILSGDSLASAFFHRGSGGPLAWQLLRRYVRLSVPVLLSSAIVYAVMVLGFDRHHDIATMMQANYWLDGFLNFEPSVLGFLRYCLWDVYVSTTPDGAYNPFLWTMQIELLGSLFVFAVCLAWPRLHRPDRWLMAAAAMLAVFLPLLAPFAIGFLFSYWRSIGLFARWRERDDWQWWSLLVIAVALALSFVKPGVRTGLVVAFVLLGCFHTHRATHRFFDNALSRWLGLISFPLYLVQFPVLVSLTSWLLLAAAQPGGQPPTFWALMVIAVVSVAACVVAAMLFQPIETRLRHAAERVVRCFYDRIRLALQPQRRVAMPQRASQFD